MSYKSQAELTIYRNFASETEPRSHVYDLSSILLRCGCITLIFSHNIPLTLSCLPEKKCPSWVLGSLAHVLCSNFLHWYLHILSILSPPFLCDQLPWNGNYWAVHSGEASEKMKHPPILAFKVIGLWKNFLDITCPRELPVVISFCRTIFIEWYDMGWNAQVIMRIIKI